MASTIFFSWQSDTPERVGKKFLMKVLQEICDSIKSDESLDPRFRDIKLDVDTSNVPGQPPVVDTIFRKLETATVVICDMTFIGTRMDGRPLPNPNVLMEYSYGLKNLGTSRILYVMNAHFGSPSRENPLPFNMDHLKWPSQYNLSPDAKPHQISAIKKKLFKLLRPEIINCLAAAPLPLEPLQPAFPSAEVKDGDFSFRKKKESIGFDNDFPFGTGSEVFLANGPGMWLRVMPTKKQPKTWPVHELMSHAQKSNSNLLPLIHPGGGYDFIRGGDGVGMYRATGKDKGKDAKGPVSIDNIAYVFETGEIWSIDEAYLSWDNERLPFLEEYFYEGLIRYTSFLRGLGIEPEFQWTAGLSGIKNRRFSYPAPPGGSFIGSGPICAVEKIEISGTYDGQSSPRKALMPFFKTIFDKCGRARPDYLPQE